MHLTIESLHHVHFIAIGGISMSALASILMDRGIHVSGSDQALNELTAKLEQRGARVHLGHRSEQVDGCDVVVYSSAIKPDNPELVRAKELGLPIWHRADLLAALVNSSRSVGVTGSHGKTTTSSMITEVFCKANLNPTAILGGVLPSIGSNSISGDKESYLVAEIDESDSSLLKSRPFGAVITNIEADHLDHYGSFERIIEVFTQFALQLPEHGFIVFGYDCPNTVELSKHPALANRRLISYSTRGDAEYRATDIHATAFGCTSMVWHDDKILGKLELLVPGEYSVQNALACIAVALEIGLPWEVVAAALREYTGPVRRFQLAGEAKGITVYDDYAHHPSEIRALLHAARENNPKRLIAVFQPHLYSRTQLLLQDFARCFSEADMLVLTDIYGAREAPVPGVDGAMLFDAVRAHDPESNVLYCADTSALPSTVAAMLQPGDCVLMIGAGSINAFSPQLLSCLQDEE